MGSSPFDPLLRRRLMLLEGRPVGPVHDGVRLGNHQAKAVHCLLACFYLNNTITARYQLNLWLVARRRLPTQALLLSYGRIDRDSCAFCNRMPDSIDYIFFDCPVMAGIAFFWVARCNLPWQNRSWGENLRWASSFLMGKDFFKSIVRFSFGALCHIIWKNNINILFRDQPLTVPAMKNHMFKVVRDKASTFRNVEDNFRNRKLQRSWGIDPIIFTGVLK